jgi:hypothetical protein
MHNLACSDEVCNNFSQGVPVTPPSRRSLAVPHQCLPPPPAAFEAAVCGVLCGMPPVSTPPPAAARVRPHSALKAPGSCPRTVGSVRFSAPDISPIAFAQGVSGVRTASPVPHRGRMGYDISDVGASTVWNMGGLPGISPIARRPGRSFRAGTYGGDSVTARRSECCDPGACGVTPPSKFLRVGQMDTRDMGISVALSGLPVIERFCANVSEDACVQNCGRIVQLTSNCWFASFAGASTAIQEASRPPLIGRDQHNQRSAEHRISSASELPSKRSTRRAQPGGPRENLQLSGSSSDSSTSRRSLLSHPGA